MCFAYCNRPRICTPCILHNVKCFMSKCYLMQRCRQYSGTLKHFSWRPSMRFNHTQATSSPLKSKNVSTAMTLLIIIIELHSLTDCGEKRTFQLILVLELCFRIHCLKFYIILCGNQYSLQRFINLYWPNGSSITR